MSCKKTVNTMCKTGYYLRISGSVVNEINAVGIVHTFRSKASRCKNPWLSKYTTSNIHTIFTCFIAASYA